MATEYSASSRNADLVWKKVIPRMNVDERGSRRANTYDRLRLKRNEVIGEI
jgi:hypothetical protein